MRTIVVPANEETLPEVLRFVKDSLDEIGCTSKEQYQIEVAVEEIFTNISSYAYKPDNGDATIEIEINDNPLSVSVCFMDNGKPYDPLAKQDPDTTLSLGQRKRGGKCAKCCSWQLLHVEKTGKATRLQHAAGHRAAW